MTIVKDVADAIDLVATGIENVRKIAAAVRDGKDYLKVKHPDAKTHVAAMLSEMQKTMTVVASASSVLTNFWFTTKSEASIERFNALFQEHKNRAADLAMNIDGLRGHCGKIQNSASAIERDVLVGSMPAFARIFERLGLRSKKREEELADLLHQLANQDFAVADTARSILKALDTSLCSVQGALGTGRVADPANIQKAGALLDEHAKAFEPLEERATKLAAEIRTLVDDLSLS